LLFSAIRLQLTKSIRKFKRPHLQELKASRLDSQQERPKSKNRLARRRKDSLCLIWHGHLLSKNAFDANQIHALGKSEDFKAQPERLLGDDSAELLRFLKRGQLGAKY